MAAKKRKKAATRKPVRKKKAAPKKKVARKKAPPRRKPAARKRKKAPPRETWGLALSGDWSRGAFLAGAVDRAWRLGRVPIVAGSGSGALVAALAALGKLPELREVFFQLDRRSLVRRRYPWLPGGAAASFLLSKMTHTQSVYVTDGALTDLVEEHVDVDALARAKVEVLFAAVDMQTGATRSFSNRRDSPEDVRAGLLAAASRPVLMPLVRAGDERHQFAEGTLNGHGALHAVFDALGGRSAPEVDALVMVSAAPPAAPAAWNAYRDIDSVLHRTVDLVTGGRQRADVRTARLINALLHVRRKVGVRAFAAALRSLDEATRAEVESHFAKHCVPVLQVCADAPAGADALDCDPTTARAAFEEGGAAVARLFG